MKKIRIQKRKITFIFQETDSYKDFVLKEIDRSFEKVKKFFNPSSFPIKVCLVYSREEFDKFIGKKTASWMVGHTNCPKNEIYLLSPLVFEKESTHRKEDFPKVLTHELTHLFTYQLYPFYEPRWLLEGLAYFVANQSKSDFRQRVKLLINNDYFLSKIDTTRNWQENLYHGAYQLSFLWTSFLIKKFGKEKILKLLGKTGFSYKRAQFIKVFEQVYQQNLNSLEKQFIKNYFSQNSKGGEIRNASRN